MKDEEKSLISASSSSHSHPYNNNNHNNHRKKTKKNLPNAALTDNKNLQYTNKYRNINKLIQPI